MIPNVTRGERIAGLLVYLAGPGRSNEHEEQHLVAGNAAVLTMHGYGVLDREAALAVAKDLDAPRETFGVEVSRQVRTADPDTGVVEAHAVAAPVWHCSLSLSAEEGQLSDERWAVIAEDFVDRMGFTAVSGKAECRWVAVRHGLSKNGNDHVHIAVSLVREDGTKASTHNDFRHAQQVCRELELEHGLMPLESRGIGLGERGVKPAERERADRAGLAEVGSHRLERIVRAAAIASVDEGEFVRRLRRGGVLVRPRFAAGRDDVIAGYSVALRIDHAGAGERPVWFGGGRLARDLTLPRLREGWPDRPETAQAAVEEWRATSTNPWGYRPVAPGREERIPEPALWKQYSVEIGALRAQLRAVPASDRSTWAHVARETAGAFAAWSQRVETTPGPLAETARELARTAHLQAHESRPKPVNLGSAANATMLLLQTAASGRGSVAEAILLRQLGRMSVAILDMHTAAGDARRAEQVAAVLRGQFAEVAARLPTVPAAAAGGRQGSAGGSGRGIPETVRRATEGLAAPGSGSPLPTPLRRSQTPAPSTPRERGGHDRN